MPVLPLNHEAAVTALPWASCAVRRPSSQSITSRPAALSVGPWTVGQPVEWFVPVMSTSATA